MLWRFTCAAVKRVRRADPFINFLGLVAGVYLAGGNLFKASDTPSKAFWSTTDWPWKALVVCAVFVPVVAFYKYLDAQCAKDDQRITQLRSDAAVWCQRVAASVAEKCNGVSLLDVEIALLRCTKDGAFNPVAEFVLPGKPRVWPVRWAKRRGVAGTAWALAEAGEMGNQALVADLTELKALGATGFGELQPDERYGLNWNQLNATTAMYSGTIAAPIRSGADAGDGSTFPAVLAILAVDYKGSDLGASGFKCIADLAEGGLDGALASIENGLGDWVES